MPKRGKRGSSSRDPASEAYLAGHAMVHQHPLFAPLLQSVYVLRDKRNQCPAGGWAVVLSGGQIHVHPTRRAEPEEWAYVLAHCLLHLGFGHCREDRQSREWMAACDAFVARFLRDLKLGRPPESLAGPVAFSGRDEERLYQEFLIRGIPPDLARLGTAGPNAADIVIDRQRAAWQGRQRDWPQLLAEGLSAAVTRAVEVAGGLLPSLSTTTQLQTAPQRARAWFVSSYPLLGALVASFKLVEDPMVCNRLGISIAAVDAESREIFINPAAALGEEACRFVIAHEVLHVGLRHHARRQGRDAELWNVACDYVINGWLIEMQVGEPPSVGILHDPALKGESAESVYDRIATDMRRYRKLATLAGAGMGDILERGGPCWWELGAGLTLDEYYRRCLGQGLAYHEDQGRGFLPAGLIEEIRALSQPPIAWDVELAQWFDRYFPRLEKVRSYARPSRRQSSTPDIPRPRWVLPPATESARTFGVLLDTSGSMDRTLLAKALGAIASYSMARDVPAARVVFCDAATYDQGYMPPEDIAGSVRVRGRGGTVLQPGVDLLEAAEDFPKKGPLLIITDGYCDRLRIRREHAFLLPAGHHLPFVPRGPVFRIS